MIRLTCSVVLALSFLCPGCGRPPARDVLPPGVYEQTIRHDDGTILRFTLSIPKGYSDQTPSPLIVALHYGGEVTPFYGRGMIDVLVGPALKDRDAIIVAPDSIARGWTNPKNETAVMEIMDIIIENYNVDTSRTLLTGFSMGGKGTWYLAGRNQDRFSAAIPIAGSPTTDVDWKIPLYVIHSRQDRVVPLGPTQQYVDGLKSKESDVTLVVIDGVSHYETPRFAKPLRAAVPWIKKVWK
jgi:predicted peptidase